MIFQCKNLLLYMVDSRCRICYNNDAQREYCFNSILQAGWSHHLHLWVSVCEIKLYSQTIWEISEIVHITPNHLSFGYPGWVRTNCEVKMRTTALIPLKIGGKVQRINPKWTDNCPNCTLLDTRNRSCKRVGIRNFVPNCPGNPVISGFLGIFLFEWLQIGYNEALFL